LRFTDRDGFYYVVDVKTHRLGTHFNMPNLTSVERLTRYYEDDKNYFVILLVTYDADVNTITARDAHFIPIGFLAWDCLTVGAWGWGQIQIANASCIRVDERPSRKRWMLELCDAMLEFYPKEVRKIHERLDYFALVRQQWEQKPEE